MTTSTFTNHYKETFYDIFYRSLNSRSSSRPPKIELTGILIPCFEYSNGRVYRYKLGTDANEYYLNVNHSHSELVKLASWEEIKVKGYLDVDNEVIDVEKIKLIKAVEPAIAT
jgi:hypothetical protein